MKINSKQEYEAALSEMDKMLEDAELGKVELNLEHCNKYYELERATRDYEDSIPLTFKEKITVYRNLAILLGFYYVFGPIYAVTVTTYHKLKYKWKYEWFEKKDKQK